ncbi:MAG: hypothetical protein FWD57_14545 [Polyangiaceae bacterium]|nr:hypothetical protein [Polyangiaceae bacterium]
MALRFPHYALLAPVVLSVPIVAIALRGCGATEASPGDSADSSVDDVSLFSPDSPSSTPTSPPSNSGVPADPCAPQPIPSTVPEGWEEYPVMDCKYRIYVPSNREYLPSPLIWEPCASTTGPLSYDCRQIHMDWPTEQPNTTGVVPSLAFVDPENAVVIALRKVYELTGESRPTAFMSMVVEADGVVRQAIWTDYVPLQEMMAWPGLRSIARGKSSWVINEMDRPNGFVRRVVNLAGDDVNLRPPVLYDSPIGGEEEASVIAGNQFYLLYGSSFRIRKWGDTTDIAYPANGGGGGIYGGAYWVGDTLLMNLAVFPTYALLRWTEQDGTQTLVGFPGDKTKGATNSATDGKDLVWIQGEDREPDDKHFPTRWIMTSKYSTDPSQIEPRRVIPWAQKPIVSSTPPQVGCGFAAFRVSPETPEEKGLLIVRLSDGVSWHLPNVLKMYPDGTPLSVGWGGPIALTCDELFAVYKETSVYNIRRVRLDSLGPGTPPPN